MLECSVHFKVRYDSDSTETSIQKLFEDLSNDDASRERFNGILDLEYDVS